MNPELEKVFAEIRRAELLEFADVRLDGPNVRSPIFGETPLHVVTIWGDADAVRVLLDAGAEIDVQGEYDCTPLHLAIMGRHAEIAKHLISRGANPKLRCGFGDAYELAAMSECDEIQMLFEAT
jgi:ankyrin repeat protein